MASTMLLHEIARVGGGVADAADARDLGHARQQRGEIPAGGRRIAIAVHVLAQQLNLGIAPLGQAARLLHHARAGAAALRAARERHHAVGALLVAALDDGDRSSVGIVAVRKRGVEGLVRRQAQAGDAAVSGFELDQHRFQLGVAGGARHQADVRSAAEDLLAFLLGHAAQHAEDFALAGVALELPQAVEHLLLGFVANAARVVEHQVGVFGRFHLGVAAGHERADDLFGIVHVHLAAEGFEIEGFPRHCGSILPPLVAPGRKGTPCARR